MFITCWGSRGSIPVSGDSFRKYGGDTTCLEIRTRDDRIIIVDAGTGIRRLGNRLLEEERYEYHMIFTHAHWDHVMGFPFFKPVFDRRARIIMHRRPFQGKFVENVLSKLMAPPNFPVRYADITAEVVYENACPLTFQVGTVAITPVPLNHPNAGSGYKFSEDGHTLVFLTDNELGHRHPGGLSFDDYVRFCKKADLLIHDAEYTPPEYRGTRGWGHSVFTDVLELALAADVKRLGLFHINQDRTDREMDRIVDDCRQWLRKKHADIDCFAVACDTQVTV